MAQSKYLTAPIKTDKMPPGVPYIVGNEAAERFSYYGMNGILVFFMTHYLRNSHGALDPMQDAQADAWYHFFVFAVYFLPLLGAFLGDAVLGKYRTILFLSIVYCFGHFALAIDHTRLGLVIGLFLIALGAGGIKPCVSVNVGDQFGATNQHLLPRVFTWFYFSINLGSAFATLLIPWLLDPFEATPAQVASWPSWLVTFLEKIHGPDIAFAIPGVLMLVATIVFWLGRKKFVHLPPVGIQAYRSEIARRENLKALGNLLMLVPFAAIFWSLWQQNFSSWIQQAEHMDRHLFGIDWKPTQIQTVNPIFILLALPLFSYWVYPAIDRVFHLTPLRKFGIGLFVAAGAFGIAWWIQVLIDAGQTPHIIWQVVAFAALSVSEVMVSVTHLEFAYTQAPKKLKVLVMCTYLASISLGNLFTACINFLKSHGILELRGANYFLFFTAVMMATTVLFSFCAPFYRGQTYIQDEAEPQPA